MVTSIYRLSFTGLACIIAASSLYAYSPSRPRPHEVFSPNGRFVLALDPQKDRQPVYSVDDRTTPLWLLVSSLWQEEYYLSDDGMVVAEVSWVFTGMSAYEGAAVLFHNADGVFQTYSFSELCPDPYTTEQVVGPVGDDWRRWLWRQSEEDGELQLHTVDGHLHYFSIRTGELLRTTDEDAMPMSNPWWTRNVVLLASAVLATLAMLAFLLRRRKRKRTAAHLMSPEPIRSS